MNIIYEILITFKTYNHFSKLSFSGILTQDQDIMQRRILSISFGDHHAYD